MNKRYKAIIISCSFVVALIITTSYSNLNSLKRLDKIIESLENINTNLEKLESQYHRLEDENATLEDNIFLKLQ